MHKYRISFLTGVAAGFVLGARAGRERYDQIVKAARAVTEHPAVQQAAGAAQAQATDLASTAGSKISDKVRDRVPQLAKTAKARAGDHAPGHRHKNGHGSPDGHGPDSGGSERGIGAPGKGSGKR